MVYRRDRHDPERERRLEQMNARCVLPQYVLESVRNYMKKIVKNAEQNPGTEGSLRSLPDDERGELARIIQIDMCFNSEIEPDVRETLNDLAEAKYDTASLVEHFNNTGKDMGLW